MKLASLIVSVALISVSASPSFAGSRTPEGNYWLSLKNTEAKAAFLMCNHRNKEEDPELSDVDAFRKCAEFFSVGNENRILVGAHGKAKAARIKASLIMAIPQINEIHSREY